MNKITPLKYEKVDDNTLRVIAEKIDDIELGLLVRNKELTDKNIGLIQEQLTTGIENMKKKLESDLEIEKGRLGHIVGLITEAEKLGIKVKEIKPAPVKK